MTRQNIFHTCAMVNSGHAALRKLAYNEAGQTLASMNEWEASEGGNVLQRVLISPAV